MSGDSGLTAGTSLPPAKGSDVHRSGTCYRFHLFDPIYFSASLRFTFEHGMNNCQANDLSSTAYWYQQEPHLPFALPPAAERLPIPQADEPDPAEEATVVEALGRMVDMWYDLFMEGSREQVVAASKGTANKALDAAGRVRKQFAAGELAAEQVLAEIAPYEEALRKIKDG